MQACSQAGCPTGELGHQARGECWSPDDSCPKRGLHPALLAAEGSCGLWGRWDHPAKSFHRGSCRMLLAPSARNMRVGPLAVPRAAQALLHSLGVPALPCSPVTTYKHISFLSVKWFARFRAEAYRGWLPPQAAPPA